MRLAWYAAASTALAGAVVVSAFHQRANFYSAMVHLAQSSLSLLVLANLIFVVYGSFMYGLQRLCFGPLRPAEIEQLYEKAWFAVTEICLAMTIFREEVGAFFLVMFTALVTGKVWGWIGEGRVEAFEQQPPANPRLFHTRLSISLLLSVIYDIWILSYAISTVVQQARPTMMVMFLFEFAVLAVCSLQTALRYIVSLVEQHITRTQTRQRLEDRRRQIREQRADILRRRETEGNTTAENEELPNEDDVDEMDIEVPGWESKGLYVLSLDLVADFVKLCLYTAFFCVLFTFYGLPIHIIRDWFMTTRSFLKRLNALIRYRQALKDMDQYPDATPEELGQEDTCIICREEMRPWDPTDTSQVERIRAKKLPCGHVLHFGCLKSWLERQQVCPTCRRPVTRDGQQPAARNGEAMVFRLGLNFPAGQNQQPQQPANGQPPAGQAPQGAAPNNQGNNNQNPGVRMFNLGPIRLGFAQGGVNDIQDMAQRLGIPADIANPPAATAPAPVPQYGNNNPPRDLDQIRAQLLEIGQRLQTEMMTLHNTAQELQVLNLLVNEIGRLRQPNQQALGQYQTPPQGTPAMTPGVPAGPAPAQQAHLQQQLPLPLFPQQPGQLAPIPLMQPLYPMAPRSVPAVIRHGAAGYGSAIPAGSPDLPEGVVIPPGWSLLPLQRLDGAAPTVEPAAPPIPATTTTPVPPSTFHEMLQALDADLPRPPRWVASSTGATAGVEPTDRNAPIATTLRPAQTGGNVADVRTGPRPTQETVVAHQNGGPSEATVLPPAEQVASPTVTAPTPVAPNWGGSAQLFSGPSAGGIFGYQQEVALAQEEEQAETSVQPTATETSTSSDSSSSDDAEEDRRTTNTKGKAKAAAVEDGSDDDEQ
ncbi:hypothetical protein B0T22DRAFT_466279 [Podospora appendiculata]|uniref:RING-type E3 ubiquitin transferase n=1 Tax=Podospora appendiculata TaxID=314037 RepID=A0AAE0X5I6_9PEZI|nr:hypothetical protein B0T22DRAFT_466279 [Podospora appendiculata]